MGRIDLSSLGQVANAAFVEGEALDQAVSQLGESLIQEAPHLFSNGYMAHSYEQAREWLEKIASREKVSLPVATAAIRIILDDIFALGPLQAFVDDREVTEINIVPGGLIFVVRRGVQEYAGVFPGGNKAVYDFLQNRLIRFSRRSINAATPYADFTRPDGTRINAVIRPFSQNGPALSIRKAAQSARRFSLEDLVAGNYFSREMADCLVAAVHGRKNIIVSGPPYAGKTTTIAALLGEIPLDERLILVQDIPELRPDRRHLVALVADERRGLTYEVAVINAMRQNPAWFILGEVRSKEGMHLIEAILANLQGAITSIHAKNPQAVLRRFVGFYRENGDPSPLEFLLEKIHDALDLILQVTREPDGTLRAQSLSEVLPWEKGKPGLKTLFAWDNVRRRFCTDPAAMHSESSILVETSAE